MLFDVKCALHILKSIHVKISTSAIWSKAKQTRWMVNGLVNLVFQCLCVRSRTMSLNLKTFKCRRIVRKLHFMLKHFKHYVIHDSRIKIVSNRCRNNRKINLCSHWSALLATNGVLIIIKTVYAFKNLKNVEKRINARNWNGEISWTCTYSLLFRVHLEIYVLILFSIDSTWIYLLKISLQYR